MNILVVEEVHPYLMDRLSAEGYKTDYHPEYTYKDTENVIAQYDGIVVRSKFHIDRALMDKGVKLQFIARAGVGLDLFDTDYARQKGIMLINAAGANANAVAEHVMGMLLSLLHHTTRSTFQVRDGKWLREENRGTELQDKTVALIGYGNVGEAVSRKLKGFDCKVLAYDKYRRGFSGELATEAKLEEIYEQADIVSLHIPLTSETEYMCDEEFFNRFRKRIYFLNTARGRIVRLSSLLQAMVKQKVLGAGLDVLENEDLQNLSGEQENIYQELFSRNNVVLSPHVGGWSVESFYNISAVLAKNILNRTK